MKRFYWIMSAAVLVTCVVAAYWSLPDGVTTHDLGKRLHEWVKYDLR